MILLRITKRKTAWEEGTTLEDTIRTEFFDWNENRLDIRPSVYFVEPRHEVVIQAHAEHQASAGLDPKGGVDVDFTGTSADIIVAEGESCFEFTRKAHRELLFESEDELRLSVKRILRSLAAVSHEVSKREVRDYAKERMKSGNPEWEEFCRSAEKAHKWGCKRPPE